MNTRIVPQVLMICLLSAGRAMAQGLPQLTPQEEAESDRVLKQWESHSAGIKTFDAGFKRWEYDPIFGPANGQPRFEDLGRIAFAAPDKGLFEVHGKRAEKWIFDGKTIHEYNYSLKKVVEHPLPPEFQGQAIAKSPLPLFFGAKAAELKQRYAIRVVTPRELRGKETWLEIHPRLKEDAAFFKWAELRLTDKDMLPSGLQLHSPNGKNRTSFGFYDIVANRPEWQRRLEGDPFKPTVPDKWERVPAPAPPAQARRGTSRQN